MKLLTPLFAALVFSVSIASNSYASQTTEVTWCVFDPIGANGPSKEAVDDYRVAALRWGVKVNAKFYTEDKDAVEGFEKGDCDLVSVPDYRARKYNHFTGSLNAVGALPGYQHLGSVIKSLASPAAEKVMVKDDYEVFGIFLVGGVHAFVRDRSWVTPEDMEGKKIAILDGVEETDYFSEQTKTIAVKADLGTTFNSFKNGAVDGTLAPLIVFEGLELSKGLGDKGGISRYPMSIVTMQTIARRSAFPEGVGQQSREYAANYHLKMVKTVESYENAVPESYYFDVPMETIYYFDNLFSKARKELAEQGIYNKKMLKLLRKIRCKSYPDRAECSLTEQ